MVRPLLWCLLLRLKPVLVYTWNHTHPGDGRCVQMRWPRSWVLNTAAGGAGAQTEPTRSSCAQATRSVRRNQCAFVRVARGVKNTHGEMKQHLTGTRTLQSARTRVFGERRARTPPLILDLIGS